MSLNFGYETEEYYREDRDPVDPDDFNRALEEQNRKSGNRDWTVSVFLFTENDGYRSVLRYLHFNLI